MPQNIQPTTKAETFKSKEKIATFKNVSVSKEEIESAIMATDGNQSSRITAKIYAYIMQLRRPQTHPELRRSLRRQFRPSKVITFSGPQ